MTIAAVALFGLAPGEVRAQVQKKAKPTLASESISRDELRDAIQKSIAEMVIGCDGSAMLKVDGKTSRPPDGCYQVSFFKTKKGITRKPSREFCWKLTFEINIKKGVVQECDPGVGNTKASGSRGGFAIGGFNPV